MTAQTMVEEIASIINNVGAAGNSLGLDEYEFAEMVAVATAQALGFPVKSGNVHINALAILISSSVLMDDEMEKIHKWIAQREKDERMDKTSQEGSR